MSAERPENAVTEEARSAAVEARIIELLQKEIQDRAAVLDRSMRRDEVAIDSIDIVNVIFALEEEFKVSVDLKPDATFETVGDLVDVLKSYVVRP